MKRTINMKNFNILIFLILILFAGCGYTLVGTGKHLPPGIKTIAIPVFKNKTQRLEIEKIITSAIVQELIRRGLKITESELASDAILKGEVISFNTYPTAFSTTDSRATKYGMVTVIRVSLISSKGDEIYPETEIRFTDEYSLGDGVDFYSIETERLAKLSEQIAKNVASLILEGF